MRRAGWVRRTQDTLGITDPAIWVDRSPVVARWLEPLSMNRVVKARTRSTCPAWL